MIVLHLFSFFCCFIESFVLFYFKRISISTCSCTRVPNKNETKLNTNSPIKIYRPYNVADKIYCYYNFSFYCGQCVVITVYSLLISNIYLFSFSNPWYMLNFQYSRCSNLSREYFEWEMFITSFCTKINNNMWCISKFQ